MLPLIVRYMWTELKVLKLLSSSNGRLVYKLNKSLYGLKQSGGNWNNVLHRLLLDNQFVQSPVDNCTREDTQAKSLRGLKCLIGSQGPHLLSRSLNLVVTHLVLPEGIVKLLVAWFMLQQSPDQT